MNITPHSANLPLATVVNPPTEGLRRDNHQREIITQVSAINPSVAEKGVASDKERARTPAQTNEQVDFANLRKQAEYAASSISEHKNQGDGHPQGEQNSQQEQEEQHSNAKNDAEDKSSEQANEQEIVDEKIINQLQHRDKEVRTHELAHARVGGAATGSPTYTFEQGPDGKKYAINGEVSVDLTTVAGDPQATIIKMQKVHAAALAPANPSVQDTRVAANAAQRILEAQSALLVQQGETSTLLNTHNNLTVEPTQTLNNDKQGNASDEFDALINQTLLAQDTIAANYEAQQASSVVNQKLASTQTYIEVQSAEVQQRSHRIENFYFKVSQGYEKPDNFQFEITA